MDDDPLREEDATVAVHLNDYQRSNLLFLLKLIAWKIGPFRHLDGSWVAEVVDLVDGVDVLAHPHVSRSFPDLLWDLKRDGFSVDPTAAIGFFKDFEALLQKHEQTAQRLGYPHVQEMSAEYLQELEVELKQIEEENPELKKAGVQVTESFELLQRALGQK